MTAYRVRYTPEAAGRLRKLHPEVKQEVRETIREFLETLLSRYSLQEELFGYCSYRVQSYRIIYRLNDEERTIDVVFVGPRRNVYEELLSLVRSPSFRNGVHHFTCIEALRAPNDGVGSALPSVMPEIFYRESLLTS